MRASSMFHGVTRFALGLLFFGVGFTGWAEPVISEFMASNDSTLADDAGDFSDWIELYNPDSQPANLVGWYLTDDIKKKTAWQLPAVTLAPQSYLVIFASGKNHRDPARPLHTSFKLAAEGGYLGLVRPDGVTVASEFAPAYPAQERDISYGVTQRTNGAAPQIGYLRSATPGQPNADTLLRLAVVSFSRPAGIFSGTFSLTLSGAGPDEHIRYVIAPPSSNGAAVAAPTASSLEYKGPITIDSTVIVRAVVFSSDDKTSGRAATAQFLRMNPSLANFSTSLPVLVLDDHGLGGLTKDGIDHPSWIYAYEPASGTLFSHGPSLASPATMSVRGNFSANFLKSSYNVTLLKEDGQDNPQPLLGLDSAKNWALVGPWFTDRAYIRNAFVYTLSNRIGRWAPRTRFVETFVNINGDGLDASDYTGIAVLTDALKIGKSRIDIASLSASDTSGVAVTGGYVFKFDPVPDPTHYNFITDHGIPVAGNDTTALVIDSPKASDLSQPQRDYIRGYVQQMENALFAAEASGFANRAYLDYVDLPSWVDHHLLEVFVGNVDALYHSDYFQKDRESKIIAGPVWDFDSSMGSVDDRNARWDTWDTTGGRGVWTYGWWGPLAHDPEFMQAWIDRWQQLRRDEFSGASLSNLANSLAAEIGPDAAARDTARWPDNQGRYPGGFLGEVAHLKEWITSRATWIDQQFAGAPTVIANDSTVHLVPAAGAQLVYTLDGSDPRSLGGAVAPGALIATLPVDLPASANIHARSYRTDRVDAFPGTPWSSAVGAGIFSPLTPKARLVNLSSRALIGSGENAMIAGVIVTDTGSKGYLARGIGPGLTAFGTSDVLPDPQLSVLQENAVELYRNKGWQNGPDAADLPARFQSVGAFPLAAGSADSAIAAQFSRGAYTLHLTSPTDKAGVGLAELYELDGNGRTLNLSTRAFVGSGGGVLIGGFVVQGPAYKRVLIRGVGPTLGVFGVARALVDPIMTVYSGNTIIATNDRWTTNSNLSALRAAAKAVGAFDLAESSEDAALLMTVPPGPYTIILSGKGDGQGVGLLEIYEVP